MISVLLVEDENAILMGLKYCLEQENFCCFTAACGSEAIEIMKKNTIDLVLLDLNLPDMSGFQVMEHLRKFSEVPIIFLTANLEEVSIVSRMNAVLRRKKKYSSNTIAIGNVLVDLNSAKVLKNGRDVMLTALEYKILLTLLMNPQMVFTREKILADIWDVNEAYVNDNTLTVYIKRIREKIEDDVNHPKIILTVRGVGYKAGEVS